jgi:hypothetical protein
MSTKQASPATKPSAAEKKKRTNAALKAWATRREQNLEKWGKPAGKKARASKAATSKRTTAKTSGASKRKDRTTPAGKVAGR